MEFRILGPFEVCDGTRVLELGGARQRVLLARLAVAGGRVVALDALIDEVWGAETPAGAKDALQAQVSRARKALVEPARLVAQPPGYRLVLRPDELDAGRFEGLVNRARAAADTGDPAVAADAFAQAEALWRGPALAEFVDHPFAQAEAARLEELRLAATEERVATELALGRHGLLAAELETLVATHPYRERLWGAWMLALYRTGRQADALAAYQRLRRTLGEDLGIEPSPDLARLEEAILLHKTELRWDNRSPESRRPAGDESVDVLAGDSSPRTLALEGHRVTIGKDESNDIAFPEDRTISSLHAALERFPAGWCVYDLGSTNGTYVTGERIWGLRRLRSGDELRVGKTKLVFRGRQGADVGRSATETDTDDAAPALTTPEIEVLRILCRPLLEGDLFTEPTSIDDMAAELGVSGVVVMDYLARLFARFDIDDRSSSPSARLAAEALRRGVVTITDRSRER